MSKIAKIPNPLYYSVIFTSIRTKGDNGYGKVSDKMVENAKNIEVF